MRKFPQLSHFGHWTVSLLVLAPPEEKGCRGAEERTGDQGGGEEADYHREVRTEEEPG